MNTVFIIGNGFDINLGMETKFKEFLEYYLTIEPDSDLIRELKKDISEKIDYWSDLEKAIGRHTAKLKTKDEFFLVYWDLVERLAEYLQEKENGFDFGKINNKKLLNYLAFPEHSLLPADKREFEEYRAKWKNHSPWNVNIITLNYTKSLEKILDYNGTSIPVIKNTWGNSIQLHRIEHIHGFLNKRMIIGVNDISQILNEEYKNNTIIKKILVKNESNKAHKELVEISCQNIISEADLICIFGSSIGDTDKIWWEQIGNQLKKGCKLIIFNKGKVYHPRRYDLIWEYEEYIRTDFLRKTKLTKEEKETVINNIFVAVNSDMFNIVQEKEVKDDGLITT